MSDKGHDDIIRSLGRIEGTVQSILDQATKTNGRVTRLEEGFTALKVSEGVTTTKFSLIAAISGIVGASIWGLFNPFK